MAKITFEGLDQYIAQLNKLGADTPGMIKQATYPAAGLVADEIKRSTPVKTGALRDSLSLVPYREDKGYVYTTITFAGTDKRGVANTLKARVLEHGSSKRQAHPFIRPAVNRVKRQAEAMMAAEFTKLCEQKMKE